MSLSTSCFSLERVALCALTFIGDLKLLECMKCAVWIRQNKGSKIKFACEFANFGAAKLKSFTVRQLSCLSSSQLVDYNQENMKPLPTVGDYAVVEVSALNSVTTLILLVGQQEGHLACKRSWA